jgi:hypothetical protein
MTVNIYVVYDTVAQSVQGGVHCFPHDAVAIRFFRDVMDAPDTSLNKHPGDYDLLCVGTLNSEGPSLFGFEVRTILTGASIVTVRSEGVSL